MGPVRRRRPQGRADFVHVDPRVVVERSGQCCRSYSRSQKVLGHHIDLGEHRTVELAVDGRT